MATLTEDGYFNELIDIHDKLIDFIDNIDKGKETYFKEISLKLRILYIFKSGTNSLLKTICDILNIDVYVWIHLSMAEKIEKGIMPKSLGEGLVFEQLNSVITWFENNRKNKELVLIFDALNKNEILLNNIKYSYKKVIENMADKMGGAHIDKTVKDEDLILHSNDFLIGGNSVAQRAIYDTAKSSILLIEQIVNFKKSGIYTEFIVKR